MRFFAAKLAMLGALVVTAPVAAQEVPLQWYANASRNMVVPARDLPDHLGDDNRLWQTKINRGAFFNIPTFVGDRILCGMSAKSLPERESRGAGLLCLSADSGEVIWQAYLSIHAGGYGLSDVPLVDDERIYVRAGGELICLDMDGQEIWRNREATREYFHSMHGPNGTGLIIGDYWWIPTSYALGSDDGNWESTGIERPFHPSIVVLNKHTGQLVAQDASVLGPFQHGQWASLSSGVVGGKRLVFYGTADGYMRAYAAPDRFPSEAVSTLEEVWRCDVNPIEYRTMEDGTPMPYAAYMAGPRDIGPCEIIAAAVFHDGLLYVAMGRDKAYGVADGKRRIGDGGIVCIDPAGTGDVTATHKRWTNTNINRTFCTPSIVDGLLFVATHAGYVHCLDVKTGEELWKEDVNATVWNYSQVVADGKLYVHNEYKDFFILKADREGGVLFHKQQDSMNNPEVGITHGMIIVGTQKTITAYGGPEHMKTHEPMAPVVEEVADDGEYADH